MRFLLVAGARPNFMKVAPIVAELARRGEDYALVHTGQHYDSSMSASFFRDLNLPAPDYHLEVGSASHAVQTARVMERFEPVLLDYHPDWVVVVGDVNSTLACALVTAKLKNELDCHLAHVEAGLRSNDWRMPEEVNRVLTDRLADCLLTPSLDCEANLTREGLDPSRIRFVGNVMVDTLLSRLDAARELDMTEGLGLAKEDFVVCTVHRPSNVDDPEVLEAITTALASLAQEVKVVLPLHPRTRERMAQFKLSEQLHGVTVTEPLGYLEMLALVLDASVVLTDSGGLQEETTVLGVPCVTLREGTERPITISEGTNRLAPWPLTAAGVVAACREAWGGGRRQVGDRPPIGWDGYAARRIVDALCGDADKLAHEGLKPLEARQ